MRLLIILVIMKTASTLTPCDKQLLPEMTFRVSGRSVGWPGAGTESIFKSAGRFVARNVIATRMQVHRDRAILAFPRYKRGVPFGLGCMILNSTECTPKIEPFPDWPNQEEGVCGAVQNAIDIFLDRKGVLWVLDTGVVNSLEHTPVKRCPPKVLAIDAETREIIQNIDLHPLVLANSTLQFLVVDTTEDSPFVYIADGPTRSIIVYDVARITGHRLFLPELASSDRSDVLHLVLVKRKLFLSYLGGKRIFKIGVEDLRQKRLGNIVKKAGVKHNEIVLLGSDNGNSMFFRIKGESDVTMWDTRTAFKPENFLLVQKGSESRLPTQVVPGYRGLVWCIESNFHDYVDDKVGSAGASVLIHPLVRSPDDSL